MTSAYAPQEEPERELSPLEWVVRVVLLVMIAVGLAVVAIG